MNCSGNRIQQGFMVPPSGEVMERATEGRKRSLLPRKRGDQPAPVTDAKLACPCRRERSMPPKPGLTVLRDKRPKSGDMGTGSNAGPLLRFGALRHGLIIPLFALSLSKGSAPKWRARGEPAFDRLGPNGFKSEPGSKTRYHAPK
jgi:hypothetical protein